MKRVLVIANNLQQAAYRLRIAAVVPLLRQCGIALEVAQRPAGVLARRKLYIRAAGFDAVVLQRRLLDPWEARLLGRNARRLLYDVDDAVMYHAHKVSAFSRWRTRRRFHATARQIDTVVAGNNYLAGIFREQGCRAEVMPTVVDCAHYRVRDHAQSRETQLVWIGSSSTLPYLKDVLPQLERAKALVPGLRLTVIADRATESSSLPVSLVQWSPQSESAALAQADIGIAPTPDDRWTRGKCGFKIIQYMAAGLPVIASPVGANAEIVRPEVTGILPARWEDWPEAIGRLAMDVEIRRRWGWAGRDVVEREYSLTRAADFWCRLLTEPGATPAASHST